MKWGRKDVFVDLGAEQLMAAEKAGQKIAVEIKSFVGPSELKDLQTALGQYIMYHDILAEKEPDRDLYLAVSTDVWRELFEEPIGQLLLKYSRVRVIIFDPEQEAILRWVS